MKSCPPDKSSPGATGIMFENESWKIRIQEQHDKAVAVPKVFGILNLLDAQDALRDEIGAQLAFVNLLAELLDPSD